MSTIRVCDLCGEAIDDDAVAHLGIIGRAEDCRLGSREYHGDVRPATGRSCISQVIQALDALRSG